MGVAVGPASRPPSHELQSEAAQPPPPSRVYPIHETHCHPTGGSDRGSDLTHSLTSLALKMLNKYLCIPKKCHVSDLPLGDGEGKDVKIWELDLSGSPSLKDEAPRDTEKPSDFSTKGFSNANARASAVMAHGKAEIPIRKVKQSSELLRAGARPPRGSLSTFWIGAC